MPSLLQELTPADEVPPHVAPWVDNMQAAAPHYIPDQVVTYQPGPHEAYPVSDLPAPADPWQGAPDDPYGRIGLTSAYLRHLRRAQPEEDIRQNLFHPGMTSHTSVFPRPTAATPEDVPLLSRVPFVPGRPDAVDPVRPPRRTAPTPAPAPVVEHSPIQEQQPLPPVANEAGVVETLREYVEFYSSPNYAGSQHGLPTTARNLLQSLSHGRHDPSYRQHLRDAQVFVDYLHQAEEHRHTYPDSQQ